MKYDVLVEALVVGAFLGAIVGGIHRWAGRKASDINDRSLKWFVWTTIITAIGFFLIHGVPD
jgi:hypothetical protein